MNTAAYPADPPLHCRRAGVLLQLLERGADPHIATYATHGGINLTTLATWLGCDAVQPTPSTTHAHALYIPIALWYHCIIRLRT